MSTPLIVDTLKVADLLRMAGSYNPRRMSEAELASLRRSLRTFGPVQPVIANRRTNRIVGGHQRVKAAHAEGMHELPVVWVDLDEPSEKQLNLALNRIHGEWDEELLAQLIAEPEASGADLSVTGFVEDEISALLDSIAGETAGLTDPDEAPAVEEIVHAQVGDVITLGEHVVVCGDAADVESWAHRNQHPVQLVVTDPPYNVDLGSKGREIANDNLSADAFAALMRGAFERVAENLMPGGALYSFMSSQEWPTVDAVLRASHFHWSSTLIWAKDRAVLSRKDYHTQFEPIWYGWRTGAARLYPLDDRTQSDLWSFERPSRSADHPTMKPVALLTRAIHNSSKRGDCIADPFLGAGSTLIACEILGRRCFGIELEPRYVDVNVRRWQAFTGRKAAGWRGNDAS